MGHIPSLTSNYFSPVNRDPANISNIEENYSKSTLKGIGWGNSEAETVAGRIDEDVQTDIMTLNTESN